MVQPIPGGRVPFRQQERRVVIERRQEQQREEQRIQQQRQAEAQRAQRISQQVRTQEAQQAAQQANPNVATNPEQIEREEAQRPRERLGMEEQRGRGVDLFA
jgi:hypothetical protein